MPLAIVLEYQLQIHAASLTFFFYGWTPSETFFPLRNFLRWAKDDPPSQHVFSTILARFFMNQSTVSSIRTDPSSARPMSDLEYFCDLSRARSCHDQSLFRRVFASAAPNKNDRLNKPNK